MTVLACAGEKGGGGKSTTAQNLAVQRTMGGKKVLLVDADPQGTSDKWAARRRQDGIEPKIECEAVTAKQLIPFLEKVADRYDDIIIDTGGADSSEMRIALMIADIIVCPCMPSQADIETLEHVNTLIGKAKAENPDLKAYVLTTQASTNVHDTDAEDMREFCASFEHLALLKTIIGARKTFKRALRDGLGVVELPMNRLNEKAIIESEALEKEIWA